MPGVKADILAQVVKFMQHHQGVEPAIPEKPLRSKVRTNCTAHRAGKQTDQSDRVDVHYDGERRRTIVVTAVGSLFLSRCCLLFASSGDEGAVQGSLGC